MTATEPHRQSAPPAGAAVSAGATVEDAKLVRDLDELVVELLAFFPPDRRDDEGLRALLRAHGCSLALAVNCLTESTKIASRAEFRAAIETLFGDIPRAMTFAFLLGDPGVELAAAVKVAATIPASAQPGRA